LQFLCDITLLSVTNSNFQVGVPCAVQPRRRTVELLGNRARTAIPAVKRVAECCQSILPTTTTATFVQNAEQDPAMFISFSADAFLKGHEDSGPSDR